MIPAEVQKSSLENDDYATDIMRAAIGSVSPSAHHSQLSRRQIYTNNMLGIQRRRPEILLLQDLLRANAVAAIVIASAGHDQDE